MILHKSTAYVLNALHANRQYIDDYVNSDDQPGEYFSKWKIPKKDGSYRLVYRAKAEELSNIYKTLYEELVTYRPRVNNAAHGFLKGRSTKTNASIHLGQTYILNIDVADFFGTISTERVFETFTRLGANAETAKLLSALCTIEGILPQGIQTSPDIANHCFNSCDLVLAKYAEQNNLKYSRYADDITFSGNTTIDSKPIIELILKEGFSVNPSKTKLQKRGSNQYVTGLTIFDSQNPRISKRYKKNLRLELHLLSRLGLEEYATRAHNYPSPPHPKDDTFPLWMDGLKAICFAEFGRINGRISYINAIEPARAKSLWGTLNAIDISILES